MKKTPIVSRTLSADRYWRLRALLKDYAALPGEMQAELQRQQEVLQQKIHATMKDAGLDPTVNYVLNDSDLSATPHAS